jgi:hypothetical protein
MSVRAESARRVLQMLREDRSVPTHDALLLRSWAVVPEDTVLPLEEIALRILNNEPELNTGAHV